MSGSVLLAACENDGCQGMLRYRWGQIEAACDTCGGRCGVAVASWTGVESPAPRRDPGGQQQAAAEKPPVHTACDKWIAVERGANGTRVIVTEPARSFSPERSMWANLSPRDVGELIDALLTACPRGALFSAEAARPGQELRERVEGVMRRLDVCYGMTMDRPGEARAYREAVVWLRAALEDPR